MVILTMLRRFVDTLVYVCLFIPTWTQLRRIGSSRLMILTVFAPFVGYIIIFNQYFIDILRVSESFLLHTGSSGLSDTISFARLEAVYLALVCLGIASLFFYLFCPESIKDHSSLFSHIESESKLSTPSRSSLLLSDVANDYRRYHGSDYYSSGKLFSRVSYTHRQETLFASLLRDMAKKLDKSQNYHDYGIITASGDYDVYEIARIINQKSTPARALWLQFDEIAQLYTSDLVTLLSLTEDRSKPGKRLLISLLYALGFCLLFYPTATTILLILRLY